MSFNQALNCLKGFSDGGWLTQGGDSKSFSQYPLAQFYTYSYNINKSFVSALSVDCFLDNVSQLQSLPEDLFDSEVLAGEIVRLNKEISHDTSIEKEQSLATALSIYMLTTKAGAQYFSTSLSKPFAFITILYPANQEHSRFLVRPFIINTEKVLSTDDLSLLAKKVGEVDLNNGHPEYFEYLKDQMKES